MATQRERCDKKNVSEETRDQDGREDGNPLSSLLYKELHALARQLMRLEHPGHPLQTTALIHEAYLRLGNVNDKKGVSRFHYLRLAARAMRRVLIDYSRYHHSLKRELGLRSTSYDDSYMTIDKPTADLIALDKALNALADIDPRIVEIVDMRFFGGMTIKETSRALGVSTSTVKRDWKAAKAWLKKQLRNSGKK